MWVIWKGSLKWRHSFQGTESKFIPSLCNIYYSMWSSVSQQQKNVWKWRKSFYFSNINKSFEMLTIKITSITDFKVYTFWKESLLYTFSLLGTFKDIQFSSRNLFCFSIWHKTCHFSIAGTKKLESVSSTMSVCNYMLLHAITSNILV